MVVAAVTARLRQLAPASLSAILPEMTPKGRFWSWRLDSFEKDGSRKDSRDSEKTGVDGGFMFPQENRSGNAPRRLENPTKTQAKEKRLTATRFECDVLPP